AAGLAAGGLTAGAAGAASAASSSCGGSGSVTTVNGTLADGAAYRLQCPPGAWNGTLYLYSHGYVAPGSANPAEDVGDPVTAAWMFGHGYALAGSSYASTGWANLLRQVFVHRAGHCAFTPAETVTAVQTLENRLATGRWHVPSPAAMNAQAAALGPQLNIFSAGGAVAATPPAFLSYSPARYLRPFNLISR